MNEDRERVAIAVQRDHSLTTHPVALYHSVCKCGWKSKQSTEDEVRRESERHIEHEYASCYSYYR